MLRKTRITLSIIFLTLITLFFLDFAEVLPQEFHVLGMIQFIPALLALNWIILVALLLLTFVFGRVYCSSICPMGVYQDIVSWIRKKTSNKKNKKRYKYQPALNILRWSFLGATLVAFLFGFSFLLGLLDPYSAFGRIAVNLFKPAYQAGNNLLADVFTNFGNNTFYRVGIYLLSLSSTIIALITLITVGILAWRNGRIYCNSVCPVGTALGFISKYALFQIRFDTEKCNLCGSCSRNCKASCIDFKNMTVDGSRCINCFNCIESCSESGLKYRLPFIARKANQPRRQFLTTLLLTTYAAGKLFAEKTLHLGPKVDIKRKQPIMPPGATTIEQFSQKCTSCHLCVSKCPSRVIKPSFLEYGIGGMMQPMLDFDHRFCNYDCTLCADICPTGALLPLTQEAKHTSQIGIVQLYLENCIVYTDETSCGACSEHCPTQAVSMIPYKGNLTIPHIKQEICVGCGGCEFICPSKPYKAIFVEGVTKHVTIELEHDEVKEYNIDDFGF